LAPTPGTGEQRVVVRRAGLVGAQQDQFDPTRIEVFDPDRVPVRHAQFPHPAQLSDHRARALAGQFR